MTELEVRRLLVALGSLTDEHRQALVLKDVHGLNYVQMANCLDVPVTSIRMLMHRARLALRAALEHIEVDAAA
jgi:RNA polymerase sigma-70 factor (ECF subfamily)